MWSKGKRTTGEKGKRQLTLPAKQSWAEKEDHVWSKDLTLVIVEPFLRSPGPTCYNSDDPITTFSSFVTDELLMTIVKETNHYAAQFSSQQPSSNQREWKTSVEELRPTLGLWFWWASISFQEFETTGQRILPFITLQSKTASQCNQFEEITQYLYFIDNDTLPAHGDEGYHQLQKILPIVNAINKACIDNYRLKQYISLSLWSKASKCE